MRRRAVLGATVALLGLAGMLVAGRAAGDPGGEKERVDARIGDLRGKLAEAEAHKGLLTAELGAILNRARAAQAAVDGAQARLGILQERLGRQRAKLVRLDGRIRLQTERIHRLAGQYRLALGVLERRARELYMTDRPDLLSFLVGADSFGDILDNLDLLRRIGRQDERIVRHVARVRTGVEQARDATRRTRSEAWRTTRAIAGDVAEQESVTRGLVAQRDDLVEAQAARRSALDEIRAVQSAVEGEVEALEAQSAALAAAIRAAQERARRAAQAQQAGGSPPVSGGPLGWPVGGAVTSGFGLRWGRMHEGIDIAVPEGTPVVAAASGIVIHAGWLGGYGNLVVVDHGGGLATAYAHNSSLAVSVGQSVGSGTVIAYSGNTGHSTGPHVHFEVRVNGAPTDPFGYL